MAILIFILIHTHKDILFVCDMQKCLATVVTNWHFLSTRFCISPIFIRLLLFHIFFYLFPRRLCISRCSIAKWYTIHTFLFILFCGAFCTRAFEAHEIVFATDFASSTQHDTSISFFPREKLQKQINAIRALARAWTNCADCQRKLQLNSEHYLKTWIKRFKFIANFACNSVSIWIFRLYLLDQYVESVPMLMLSVQLKYCWMFIRIQKWNFWRFGGLWSSAFTFIYTIICLYYVHVYM